MAVNKRWRYNPFTGVFNYVHISDEDHIIEYHAEPNAYGFYCDEGVRLDSPTSTMEVVTDETSPETFTEVPKTVAPNAGEFRVDYDANGYFNTGFVNCNASDNGKAILVSYYATGTIDHPTYRSAKEFNFAGSVNTEQDMNVEVDAAIGRDLSVSRNADVAGDSAFHGSVSMASDTGSEITANSKQVQDVADPDEDTDADTQGARDSAIAAAILIQENGLPFRNYQKLTTSGTWTNPDPTNIKQVFAIVKGGGGGGGGGSNSTGTCGAGGASGGEARGLITVGGTQGFTIGAGGAGAPGGTATGSVGSNSVFGTLTGAGGGAGSAGGGSSSVAGFGSVSGGASVISNGYGGVGGGHGGGTGGQTNGAGAGTGTAGGSTVANTGGGGGGGGGGSSAGGAGSAGGSGYIELWY